MHLTYVALHEADMVHGCKVYTERAEMAAVSRGTSHVSTPLGWILKNALEKASHPCRITCERSESARERRIALCKSEQRQQQLTAGVFITQLAEREKPGAILTRVRVRGAARDFSLRHSQLSVQTLLRCNDNNN